MPTRFKCPNCQKEIYSRYLRRGEPMKCSSCNQVIIIPLDAVEEIAVPISATFASQGITVSSVLSAESSEEVDQSLVGIGGWLLFPAAGLIVGLVLGFGELLISAPVWAKGIASRNGPLVGFVVAVYGGVLAYATYATVLFFGKKRNAPSALIWLMIISILIWAAIIVIGLLWGVPIYGAGGYLLNSLWSAAIWIPYFKYSKRVKWTFTK